jgi:hypothetical protein
VAPDLDRPRDLARILDDAFALYRAHWRILLPLAAAVVVPVQLGVLGVGLGWLWSGYDGNRPLSETAIGGAAEFLVVTPLVTAIVVHVVLTAARGGAPRAREALVSGLEVFGALFAVVVLFAVGVIAGFVAFVVPGIVFAVRWAVASQVVVVEGRRGTQALRRSWELVKGHGWWTFAVLFVVNLIASVFAAVLGVPGALVADALDSEAVDLATTMLGQIVVLPLVALAGTLLFFTLRAGADGPPAADAGDAWERRRREGWEPPA